MKKNEILRMVVKNKTSINAKNIIKQEHWAKYQKINYLKIVILTN